jgi:glycerol kinase
VAGVAGDQQAALFGQACLEPGLGKNTYGTGSFVLLNAGEQPPAPVEGLLSTVAWGVGDRTTYALEAAIFVTGAAVQWLRDGLGIVATAGETEELARSASRVARPGPTWPGRRSSRSPIKRWTRCGPWRTRANSRWPS